MQDDRRDYSHRIRLSELATLEGVCELTHFAPSGTPSGYLLIDIPHGATRRADYDAVAARMKGELPAQLDHFFSVNTDIGAPEAGAWLGETLSGKGVYVVLARCLIPRTFIDTNRIVVERASDGRLVGGMTPAVPGYINHPEDVAWLEMQHTSHARLVNRAYQIICGELGGLSLQLHSYAPKSVDISRTDAQIVEALHEAYLPEAYAKWPERPPVDFICTTPDGSFTAAPHLVAAAKQAFAEAGITAAENGTYHLHPISMGYLYAKQYPIQVLCVELNRGLLADPFVPFGVSPINPSKVAALAAPLAAALSPLL